MSRFLKILLSLILLLVIVALATPFLVPADKIKEEVLAQIETRTGRKVTIDHASFSIFPTLGLDAQNVSVSNPDWATGTMAEIKTLKVGLELLPLLHGEYRLKELTLEQPVITLIKQQGKANWDFSKAISKTPAAPESQKPADASGTARPSLPDLNLDKITITDGTITYKDNAEIQTIPGINLTLKAPDLSAKADIEFTALYGGQKLTAMLTIDKPLALAGGGEAGVHIKASYGALDLTWEGTAALPRKGVPTVTGKIYIASLDTTQLPQKEESAMTPSQQPRAPAPSGSSTSRWSDAPLPLNSLKGANADVTLSIGNLTLPKTTLDTIVIKVRLAGGVMQLQTDPIKAYGGTFSLSAEVTSAGAVHITFSAMHTEAEPLLRDFAGYDKLSGTLDMQEKLTANGNSQRALIGSLAGQGNISLKSGKIKGVNLANLMRNLAGVQSENGASTDFSELSASYTIAQGIATTSDIKLNSSLLHVSGAGTLDLPDWQVNILLKPMLVASQSKDASGIVVPVRVEGPLDHPSYKPDLQAALKDNLADPSKLKGDLKDLRKTFLNKDTLQNLLR